MDISPVAMQTDQQTKQPSTQMLPAHVLQVVERVQMETIRQNRQEGARPHVSYLPRQVASGRVGVGVSVSVGDQTNGVMPPPQMQRPLPVQMSNLSTNPMSMDQWTEK